MREVYVDPAVSRYAVELASATRRPGEHGLPEPVFGERNSAQRQRALLAEGATPREVYAATVRETRATYAQEVPTA